MEFGDRLRSRRGGTVFWKVAVVLIGVQVATALLAVVLSAFFARERSLDLVQNSLTLRLDGLAEEIELRSEELQPLNADGPAPRLELSTRLRLDLATRFPDPLYLVDGDGSVIEAISATGANVATPEVPPEALEALAMGQIALQVRGADTWAVTPILDADGLPAGGVFVTPLDGTLTQELAGPRAGYMRAMLVVGLLAALMALALGALFTWRLVRPLRSITGRVEAIGAGDLHQRLDPASDDELGRLASAVNEMAAKVEASLGALRAVDRARRELVANVGHDLRTPLAAISGYLEEAERLASEGRPADSAEALATARAQTAHIGRLIDDLFELSLLDAAALEAGPPPLRLGPVPIGELVADAARAHRRALEAAGLTLTVSLPPGLPVIEGDGARLMRVLDNLLRNAAQHTSNGGRIEVEARPEGEMVMVMVSDSGAGMPAEELETVFERYYRGHAARTRGVAGSGLGLAISRAIARAHGGDLTAQSIPDHGSTFVLSLPAGS